jgi:sec-independent protein translocase protein TatB
MSGHFRAGIDAMVREAELDEMEKKWKAQNEKIMRDYPAGTPAEAERTGAWPAASAETAAPAAPLITAAAPGEASPAPAQAAEAPADPTAKS